MPDELPQDRLAAALANLGWSSQQLARHLGIRENTVRGWLGNRRPVPSNVLGWIEDRAARATGGPELPDGWTRSDGGDGDC